MCVTGPKKIKDKKMTTNAKQACNNSFPNHYKQYQIQAGREIDCIDRNQCLKYMFTQT